MRNIADSVVVVTGASSGIGAAVARKVLEAGGRVVAVALERAHFGAGHEARLHWIELDLSQASQIAPAFADLPKSFASVTALVNCAGHDAGGRVRFDEMSLDHIANIIAVNLTGTMLVTRVLLPALLEAGGGDIVNIGSISAKEAIPTIAAYSASKHGVHGFTAALRADLSGTGMRVTEIVPGKTHTNFATARWQGDAARGEAYYANSPLGCLTVEDVARTVIWVMEQPRGVTVSEVVVLPVVDIQITAEPT